MKRKEIRRQFNLPEEVPILDVASENFKEEFAFNVWSTFSCSDYRNDRERPYNGQPQTSDGERGKTEVKGITFRDLQDCMIQGFLNASDDNDLAKLTFERNEEFKNTEYACKGTWRPQDVYKIKDDLDPLAVIQNALCFVEFYMGIFPNVPPLNLTPQK